MFSKEVHMLASQQVTTGESTRRQALISKLQEMTGPLLHLEPAKVDAEARFLEMGADSLVLIEAVRSVEETFGITLTIQQLFEDVTSLADLAAYLDRMLPPDVTVGDSASQAVELAAHAQLLSSPAASPLPTVSVPVNPPITGTALEQIFSQQLQIIVQQLELLKGHHSLQPDHVLGALPLVAQSVQDSAPTTKVEFVEIEL
jgi:iturin family lipopeptide synthetase A